MEGGRNKECFLFRVLGSFFFAFFFYCVIIFLLHVIHLFLGGAYCGRETCVLWPIIIIELPEKAISVSHGSTGVLGARSTGTDNGFEVKTSTTTTTTATAAKMTAAITHRSYRKQVLSRRRSFTSNFTFFFFRFFFTPMFWAERMAGTETGTMTE